jgi:hypothetical protein
MIYDVMFFGIHFMLLQFLTNQNIDVSDEEKYPNII